MSHITLVSLPSCVLELANDDQDVDMPQPGDVPMDELFRVSEQMDEDEDGFGNEYFDESRVTSPKNQKKNSACTRQKWTEEEEEEIKRIFHKCFEEKRRPTPAQCLKAIRISKTKQGLIHLRKKSVLKKKVFRMIDSEK